jgi:hypothetical protein
VDVSVRWPSACRMEVFWLVSQPLLQLRFNLFISETFAIMVEPLYETSTSKHKQETFLYEYPLHWVLLPIKNAQENEVLRQCTSQARSLIWLLKPTSEHAHAYLQPRLTWSWIILLLCDTHRKKYYFQYGTICDLFTDSPSYILLFIYKSLVRLPNVIDILLSRTAQIHALQMDSWTYFKWIFCLQRAITYLRIFWNSILCRNV